MDSALQFSTKETKKSNMLTYGLIGIKPNQQWRMSSNFQSTRRKLMSCRWLILIFRWHKLLTPAANCTNANTHIKMQLGADPIASKDSSS